MTYTQQKKKKGWLYLFVTDPGAGLPVSFVSGGNGRMLEKSNVKCIDRRQRPDSSKARYPPFSNPLLLTPIRLFSKEDRHTTQRTNAYLYYSSSSHRANNSSQLFVFFRHHAKTFKKFETYIVVVRQTTQTWRLCSDAELRVNRGVTIADLMPPPRDPSCIFSPLLINRPSPRRPRGRPFQTKFFRTKRAEEKTAFFRLARTAPTF